MRHLYFIYLGFFITVNIFSGGYDSFSLDSVVISKDKKRFLIKYQQELFGHYESTPTDFSAEIWNFTAKSSLNKHYPSLLSLVNFAEFTLVPTGPHIDDPKFQESKNNYLSNV